VKFLLVFVTEAVAIILAIVDIIPYLKEYKNRS
jgi:hypothetical protein